MKKTNFSFPVLKYSAIGALGLVMLAGCATEPPSPQAALQAAELAIADADQARVADYASLELTEARSKLNAARSAERQEKMVLALRLAEQSEVEARLASAKAEMLKEQAVNDDMKDNIDTLKNEMERNFGVKQ